MENKEPYADHASRVREAVKASSWTIAALAVEIGKKRSYISNVLSGRYMSRPVLDAIEDAIAREEVS